MKIDRVISSGGIEIVSRFLSTAPRDELYSTKELSEKFDIPESTIVHSKVLKESSMLYDGRRYWGSPVATKEFLRQINEG